jgi:hypothetical protein
MNWTWWCMPEIQALWRQRQEDGEVVATLGYIASLAQAGAT